MYVYGEARCFPIQALFMLTLSVYGGVEFVAEGRESSRGRNKENILCINKFRSLYADFIFGCAMLRHRDNQFFVFFLSPFLSSSSSLFTPQFNDGELATRYL